MLEIYAKSNIFTNILDLCVRREFLKKSFLSLYRFLVSFSQGGTGVSCPPFSVFPAPFLSCLPALPALPMVVGGGSQVYGLVWGVGRGGFLL